MVTMFSLRVYIPATLGVNHFAPGRSIRLVLSPQFVYFVIVVTDENKKSVQRDLGVLLDR